jgi:O-antigen biosynthesis protein WbqV
MPWLIYVQDLAIAALVMAGVIVVRYHFVRPLPIDMVVRATVVFVAVCAVVFAAFRLHRGLWRYTALNDVVRVFQSVTTAVMVQLPLLFLIDRLKDFPRSTPLFVIPILTAVLSLERLLSQVVTHGDWGAVLRFEDRALPAAVVVGSSEAAADYLRTTRRGRRTVRVSGIVVLDKAHAGRTILGAEVMGSLPRLAPILQALSAAENRPPQVILAERRPGRAVVEAVLAAAGEVGAQVVSHAAGGALRPVQASALLDRRARNLDLDLARSLVAGRRVLVTGAGGTIGSELSRQILALGPQRLVLFDASEFNLYAIDQSLGEEGAPRLWATALGDVRDRRRLEVLFDEERPEVVLHAAALKHVPLMEANPCETVLTNVIGAANVARLARDHASVLVFISTDKAVNPTNVMGVTKRIAERVVQAIARGGAAKVAVVRFGNVLGSTGSVVPLFERQIASGGPVTLTHPDVVRFFMTVREAAALVLQAAALPAPDTDPGSSQVYVLDMGEPVKIADLARQMIRLHGLRPDVDIEIVHTGLRPGEKLYEEIFYDVETVRPTAADGVLSAFDSLPAWSALEPRIDALRAAAEARDEAETLRLLHALEPAFQRG